MARTYRCLHSVSLLDDGTAVKIERFREIALLHCRLDPSRPVLAGVSGGADSLCLMFALAQLGFPVIAAHFDHQLRPDSAADAAVVEREASRLGLAFVSGSADVAAFARQEHLSIEAAARTLRYRFLFAQARGVGAQAVAVGHTADDQVETVLLHFLRGSGLAGLAGMEYRRVLPEWDADIPLVRPLLDFWRVDTEAFCAEHNLHPVTDATNADTAYARNRIRHELIPLLEKYNPQIRRAMWRMARTLAGDAAVIQAVVDAAWETCAHSQGPRFARLRMPELQAQPVGVQRGLVRRAAGEAAPLPDGLDFDAVERALTLVREPAAGVVVELADDLRAWVEGDLLVLARKDAVLPIDDSPQMPIGCDTIELPVPGTVYLPGGWAISAEVKEVPERVPGDAWLAFLDADALAEPIYLRCARPGERFQPLGMDGRSIKLSDFWTNVRLPRRLRALWPLVTCGDAVVWITGLRIAHPYRVTKATRRVVALRAHRAA